MAVSTLQSNAKGIEPVGTLSGGLGTVPMLEGQEASTQTFIKGAVLVWSSGQLAEASADVTSGIAGVAAEAATGTQGTRIKYWPASVNTIWEATLEDQTNEDHALVITNMGVNYALQTDTPGNWYVDENDTTNDAALVIAPRDWDDVTNATVRARVKFVFVEDTLAQTS